MVRPMRRAAPGTSAARGGLSGRRVEGGDIYNTEMMVHPHKPNSLPVPDEAALAHSETLLALIAAEIRAAGGWLPFDRYMERSLYTPGLGYYSGGAAKFGWRAEDGSDFITAPELTPLFAHTLSRAVAQA